MPLLPGQTKDDRPPCDEGMTLMVEGPAALTALLGGLENNARYVQARSRRRRSVFYTVFDVGVNGITGEGDECMHTRVYSNTPPPLLRLPTLFFARPCAPPFPPHSPLIPHQFPTESPGTRLASRRSTVSVSVPMAPSQRRRQPSAPPRWPPSSRRWSKQGSTR